MRHRFEALLGWILDNPVLVFVTAGLAALLHAYIARENIVVLTNKRLICATAPTLFTRDRIDHFLDTVESIKLNESFFGNQFGWVTLTIKSKGRFMDCEMVTMEAARGLREKFVEMRSAES